MEKFIITNHYAVKKKEAMRFINKLLMEKSELLNKSPIKNINEYLHTQDEISNAMLFIAQLNKPD